jgi:hypothetical protein
MISCGEVDEDSFRFPSRVGDLEGVGNGVTAGARGRDPPVREACVWTDLPRSAAGARLSVTTGKAVQRNYAQLKIPVGLLQRGGVRHLRITTIHRV